tara:strand:- start:956 stop:1138 length:183 start_codon:yes stop_codon:yes gene_type:complete
MGGGQNFEPYEKGEGYKKGKTTGGPGNRKMKSRKSKSLLNQAQINSKKSSSLTEWANGIF